MIHWPCMAQLASEPVHLLILTMFTWWLSQSCLCLHSKTHTRGCQEKCTWIAVAKAYAPIADKMWYKWLFFACTHLSMLSCMPGSQMPVPCVATRGSASAKHCCIRSHVHKLAAVDAWLRFKEHHRVEKQKVPNSHLKSSQALYRHQILAESMMFLSKSFAG